MEKPDFPPLPLPSGLRMSEVLSALVRVSQDLETELASERQRADLAEQRLESVERELADTREQLRHLQGSHAARQAAYEERLSRLRQGFAEYIEEAGRAHQALVSLVRAAFGLPEPVVAGAPEPAEGETGAAGPVAGQADGAAAAEDVPRFSGLRAVPPVPTVGRSDPTAEHPAAGGFPQEPGGSAVPSAWFEDEITDEHRIIDARNRLDMDRLDAPSYVRSLRARG